MKLNLAAYAFASATTSLMFATATDIPVLNETGSVERLTLQGVLVVAVIYLYRELRAERTKGEQLTAEAREFIVEQSKLMRSAAESQGEALGQVAQVLGKLEATTREQVDTYRQHIDALVTAATTRASEGK